MAEADVEDGVVAGVVDDERAVGAAEHPAGEHDVAGRARSASSATRQSAADGNSTGMLDMRTRAGIVRSWRATPEHVRVAVHRGPHAVEQVQPAVAGA